LVCREPATGGDRQGHDARSNDGVGHPRHAGGVAGLEQSDPKADDDTAAWTTSHTTQDTSRAKNPMFSTTTHNRPRPAGWEMVSGAPLASTPITGAEAAMAKGTNITAPNSRPRANRIPPTRRQRLPGRCPSGYSHRAPAVRTRPAAQAGWRAIASRPRGRVP
jgi:hypothetical protein